MATKRVPMQHQLRTMLKPGQEEAWTKLFPGSTPSTASATVWKANRTIMREGGTDERYYCRRSSVGDEAFVGRYSLAESERIIAELRGGKRKARGAPSLVKRERPKPVRRVTVPMVDLPSGQKIEAHKLALSDGGDD